MHVNVENEVNSLSVSERFPFNYIYISLLCTWFMNYFSEITKENRSISNILVFRYKLKESQKLMFLLSFSNTEGYIQALFQTKWNLGDKVNIKKSSSNLLWLYLVTYKKGILKSFLKMQTSVLSHIVTSHFLLLVILIVLYVCAWQS